MARRAELGSPKKGLGAHDQIGDRSCSGRAGKLRCVPLGRAVSTAQPRHYRTPRLIFEKKLGLQIPYHSR